MINVKIVELARRIVTNAGIARESLNALDELPDYRDGFAGWSREKLSKVAAEAEGKYNRAVAELAAALGTPVEIPEPETAGRYFVREAGSERFDVVEIFDAFEKLHVSYLMQDRATTIDDPRFDGARWWTCLPPASLEADGGDNAKG